MVFASKEMCQTRNTLEIKFIRESFMEKLGREMSPKEREALDWL